MIADNIKDYVKVYENIFEKQHCNEVTKNLEALKWEPHSYYRVDSKKSTTFQDDFDVAYTDMEFGKKIQDKLWFVIEKYILQDFKKFNEWFNGWSGYTNVRFNRYTKNTRMRIHCDHIHSMFDGKIKGIPTLSVLGVLNDNYEGGELVMWESEKISMPTGSVIVFPSNFMYPHKVNPIKKGIRYSYVSWVW